MLIRRLVPSDAAAYLEVRLQALLDAPSAFAVSHEEESAHPLSHIEALLEPKSDRAVFGAFVEHRLVGMAALGREGLRKLSHKTFIWGMYVAPKWRQLGVGRGLLLQALDLARTIPGVVQVNLCVNASNVRAIALYESAGFKIYGREPSALHINGEFHDELNMAWRPGSPTA